MSQTEIATQVIFAQSQDRAVFAGVALSSFAALLLELALTRLFSDPSCPVVGPECFAHPRCARDRVACTGLARTDWRQLS